MDFLASPGTVALAILALGILIIVHEGGHFLVARLSGMRVERFSIGFGPKLWSFKRGETIYQIAAIPLGGFVQIAGLTPGEEESGPAKETAVEKDGKFVQVDRGESDPRLFPNRPIYQRIATIFAGPATNYIFAAIMMVVIYLMWGVPAPGRAPVVDGVIEGKPAAVAGFQEGDEIVSIGGKKVSDTTEVAPIISASKGAPLVVEVLRGGKPVSLTVQAAKDGDEYRIGIQIGGREIWEPAPVGTRIKEALIYPVLYSKFVLQTLFTGGFRQIIREGSGPIGIVKAMRKQIALGPQRAMMVIAAISIYLGLFNLLPLPGLDGGRLAFLGWEAISRRRVNQRIEQMVHMVGVLALLLLIVFISFKNDLHLGALFRR
jgi:regulator of sigma E protease